MTARKQRHEHQANCVFLANNGFAEIVKQGLDAIAHGGSFKIMTGLMMPPGAANCPLQHRQRGLTIGLNLGFQMI